MVDTKGSNKKNITIEDSFQVLKKTDNSAIEVAEYLLSLDSKREYFTKNTISFDYEEEQLIKELLEGNFRLNKMLHMCQIFHCVKH